MANKPLHPLLKRQLRKVGATLERPPSPEDWPKLLARIDRAYTDADQERYTLERSLKISSNEMQELYEDLRRSSESLLTKERDRLRAVLNGSGDGICAIDADGQIALINPAGESMLGYAPGELYGQNFVESVLTGASKDAWLSEGVSLRDDDASFRRADHSELPVAFICSRIESEDAQHGAVVVFRDVTRQKQTAAALSQARDQALRASDLKSEFLATMSHEIRTPLNGVLGMTQVLLDLEPCGEQAEGLQIIYRSGEHLLHIINDILDFSKIEAGRMELDSTDFELATLTSDTLATLRELARAKSLDLRVSLDPKLPAKVCGDPARFRQILMNLVGNALKFTSEGFIELRLSLVEYHDKQIVIRVEVEDTGIGIPAHALPRLFEAFTQADGSSSRRFGGTGLGLSITKQLVTLMQGEIGVHSELGKGSIFTATVALAEAKCKIGNVEADTDDPKQEQSEAVVNLFGARTLRVLVAEDNPVNQRVAVQMLRHLGCVVQLANDGLEALDACRNDRFDIVFMDCQMPEMDGFHAAAAIRALPGGQGTIPIIAMTANVLESDLRRCLTAGMDDCITKPVHKDRVRSVLTRFCGEQPTQVTHPTLKAS